MCSLKASLIHARIATRADLPLLNLSWLYLPVNDRQVQCRLLARVSNGSLFDNKRSAIAGQHRSLATDIP